MSRDSLIQEKQTVDVFLNRLITGERLPRRKKKLLKSKLKETIAYNNIVKNMKGLPERLDLKTIVRYAKGTIDKHYIKVKNP